MESRLITIVFIDMQGYTRRSASQNIEEMKLFHDQMFKFVGGIFEKFDGIMVKTMGDGFMARFDSPTKAVQAGIEIQRRLKSRNSQILNPDDIVRFRVGINTGEVGIDENGDLFGDPVNIAARIQTFADTNDVFISETTYMAMNRNEFGAVDMGAQDLKNATREIRIYKVLQSGAPGITIPHNKTTTVVAETATKPDYKKIAAIAAIVFVTLALGVFIGRRRGRVQPVEQPAVNQISESAQPDTEPGAENISDSGLPEDSQPAQAEQPTQVAVAVPVPPSRDQNVLEPDGNQPQLPMQPPVANRNFNERGTSRLPRSGERQTFREKMAQARESSELQEKTFLELDLSDPSLPIDPRVKEIAAQIQVLAADKDFDNALKATMEQFQRTPGPGKEMWAMVAAEIHWLKGDKQKAEEIFNRVLEAARLPHARRMTEHRISVIKKRSPLN